MRVSALKNIAFNSKVVIKFFFLCLPFVYLVGMINAWLFHLSNFIGDLRWQDFVFSGWISYGGIIGALLFGLLYPKIFKDGSTDTLDIVALILPLFEAIYRIGCLLNGCCYGKEAAGFGGLYLPDSSGRWLVRYPTQILYIGLGFGLFFLLWLSRKKKGYEGEIALRYLILYGLGRFLIDGLRANLVELGRINLHQAADLGLLIIGITIWCLLGIKTSKKRESN